MKAKITLKNIRNSVIITSPNPCNGEVAREVKEFDLANSTPMDCFAFVRKLNTKFKIRTIMRQYTLSYQPESVEQLRNGLYRVFYSVVASQETDTHTDEEGHTETITRDVWICKAVDIAGPLNKGVYAALVSAIIRNEYTIDEELALARHARYGSHEEEVQAHDEFAESAKAFAKNLLGIE